MAIKRRQTQTTSRTMVRRHTSSSDTAQPGYHTQRYRCVNGTPSAPHTQTRVRAHSWDIGVFFAVLLLLLIGLVALFSASYSTGYYNFGGDSLFFVKQQGINAAIGIVAMILISKVNYKIYARFYKVILVVSIVLLILVPIPGVGTWRNGAQRWLFGFQPSELAKISVIICFAYWISKNPQKIRTFKGLIYPYGVLLAVYVVLLALEPHTSAMMIVCGIGICILVAGGMRLWYFGPIGVAAVGVMTAFYFMFDHVRDRFSVWLDPFSDMAKDGFQGSMSQIAIGSGGFFGLGLGQGRQKHLYLPEPQNDFVFASWCEEMGFIGAALVILLFAYLACRGFRVARAAPDKFSSLLATGITVKLCIQILMNLYVITGIIPVTGAALPFFSYGGTALLMQLGEMGILLNISRYMRIDARQED